MNQHRFEDIHPTKQSPTRPPQRLRIPDQPPSKQKRYWRVVFFSLVAASVVLASLTSKTISSEDLFGSISHLPIIRDVAQWTEGISDKLGGDDHRINVLLLGMPGPGHDGFLLTDTIMFASYDPDTDHVALVSIPRDLYAPVPGYGMLKINAANAYGEQDKYRGGGAALTAKTIENIFDQKIDYFLRVDFSGFERSIDLLGGIDIYVERNFTDNKYPTEDFLTQTISFERGWQHMDGATALTYVRSRHGNNGEGSDFARSLRQQKVLAAVRSKVLSLKILLNPKKISSLAQEVSDDIQTNVSPWQIPDLIKVANNFDGNNITNIVLDDSPGGYLVPENSPETGFILVPRDGTFQAIQQMLKTIHLGGKIELEKANVYLLNGTATPGMARLEQKKLEQQKVHVVGTGNAPDRQYTKTVIYDLSNEKKDTTLKYLKATYQANVTKKIPEFLTTSSDPDVQAAINPNLTDFLVILGNANN